MLHLTRRKRILIIAVILLVCIAAGLMLYKSSRSRLLDRSAFSALQKDISEAAESGEFDSQQALGDYITSWADQNAIEYTIDGYGNIIFDTEAAARKKNVAPTIICVSYNYVTAGDNSRVLASAAMIAASDIEAGRRTFVFVNDENNTGLGYRGLSGKLFRKSPKVIYLDYGGSAYISNASFAKKYSSVKVKASLRDPVCDTAVRVRISGLTTAVIGTGISNHPDPVGALSTLLSRLKSKSAAYQLASLEVGSNGSMYPDSVEAVIMLNSYAVPSFTKYIDKRIKAWEKAYGDDYEDLEYTYELIDDPEELPEQAYSRGATEKLTNVLYTIQSGLYIYEETDEIPEGSEAGDIYGINAVTNVRTGDGGIYIDIMTQAADEDAMAAISSDNAAAAELFGCTATDSYSVPAFYNDKDSLLRTFRSTYFKVNNTFSFSDVLPQESDRYFSPCSYLADKSEKADIIHIHMDSGKAQTLTNTILCYIAYKGNILF